MNPNPLTTTTKRWNPFQEFEDLQHRLRSLFIQNGGEEKPGLLEGSEFADWQPAVDVSEDEQEYRITADLPDVKKEDIKVTQDDGTLVIQGERKREEEEKKKTWHRIERSYGKYIRRFQMPEEVDAKKIDASFKDGVLTIHLPKLPEKKQKKAEHEIAVK